MHFAETLGFPSGFCPGSLIWMFPLQAYPPHDLKELNIEAIPSGIITLWGSCRIRGVTLHLGTRALCWEPVKPLLGASGDSGNANMKAE